MSDTTPDQPRSASPPTVERPESEATHPDPPAASPTPPPLLRQLGLWSLICSISVLALLIFYINYTRVQVDTLIRSVETLARSIEIHARPWIVLADVRGPKRLAPRGHFPFVWRLKNVGTLPALAVSTRSNWSASGRVPPDPTALSGGLRPESPGAVIGPLPRGSSVPSSAPVGRGSRPSPG